MPSRVPRLPWQSSMIAPMNSLGARIVARTLGSRDLGDLAAGELAGVGHVIEVPSSIDTS